MSIVSDKLDRLESIPDKFLKSIDNVQKESLIEVVSLLDILERKDGKILLNEKNLANITTISERLKDSMFKGEYLDAVREYVGEFETQVLLNNEFFSKTLKKKFTEKDIYKSILSRAKTSAVDLLNEPAIETNIMAGLKKTLENSISNQASLKKTIASVTEYFGNTENGQGALRRYAGTFATDTFNRFDRSYTKVLADDFEVKKFEYSGGLVGDSRDFCTARVGGQFTREQIESWATLQWQGKFNGTDATNIFVVLGGYNCLHSLIPVE